MRRNSCVDTSAQRAARMRESESPRERIAVQILLLAGKSHLILTPTFSCVIMAFTHPLRELLEVTWPQFVCFYRVADGPGWLNITV